jgi:hypothetical protein
MHGRPINGWHPRHAADAWALGVAASIADMPNIDWLSPE